MALIAACDVRAVYLTDAAPGEKPLLPPARADEGMLEAFDAQAADLKLLPDLLSVDLDSGPRCPTYSQSVDPSRPPYPCEPGQQMWCDDPQLGYWGTVTCNADGEWSRKMVDGKTVLDCQAHTDGRRPDTDCACHHYYYNPRCCECRPGCLLPVGGTGRICAHSRGRLCDHCDPVHPECVELGALCAVNLDMETFCTRPCAEGTCPPGFLCYAIEWRGTTSQQCVPDDFSCYD